MRTLAADLLLLSWIVVSVLATGIAACRYFRRLKGIELLGYGVGIGVFVQALFGVLIAFSWSHHRLIAWLSVACSTLALASLIRGRVWQEITAELSNRIRLSLVLWLAFMSACIAITHIDITWPVTLPDGRFILKEHTLNVKLQQMCGLPFDNYIPYVVTEFFLRGISFRDVHPIIPGNEVSNRTILMSLVSLPFRTLLHRSSRISQNEVGTFEYVGKRWPDIGRLYSEKSYSQSLTVGIFLNSLLLLALIVLFSENRWLDALPIGVALYITNLFTITQTIFIWPKAFGGFFVVLAWHAFRRDFGPLVVGFWTGLAYHCHPAYGAFVLGFGLWYARDSLRDKTRFRFLLRYALVISVLVAPWLIWTTAYLQLPSDLFAQNFSGQGTANVFSAPVNFIWVRLANFVGSMSPVPFQVYPFHLQTVVACSQGCIPAVVGLLVVCPAFSESRREWRKDSSWLLYGVLVPGVIILSVFSLPASLLLFGWQPIIGALMFLGAAGLGRNVSATTLWIVAGLQILCNLALVMGQAFLIGAHL